MRNIRWAAMCRNRKITLLHTWTEWYLRRYDRGPIGSLPVKALPAVNLERMQADPGIHRNRKIIASLSHCCEPVQRICAPLFIRGTVHESWSWPNAGVHLRTTNDYISVVIRSVRSIHESFTPGSEKRSFRLISAVAVLISDNSGTSNHYRFGQSLNFKFILVMPYSPQDRKQFVCCLG